MNHIFNIPKDHIPPRRKSADNKPTIQLLSEVKPRDITLNSSLSITISLILFPESTSHIAILLLDVELPDLILVDGGRGQLNAGISILEELTPVVIHKGKYWFKELWGISGLREKEANKLFGVK